MENTAAYWSEVKNAVLESGCPVTSIAFGPESDETLLQEIATDTGGSFFYNDVYVSARASGAAAALSEADMALDLGNTYLYGHGQVEGRARLMRAKDVATMTWVNEHPVLVDSSVSQILFVVDWDQGHPTPRITLLDPGGNEITPFSFYDSTSGHAGWRIEAPEEGEWTILVRMIDTLDEVPYQALAEAHTPLTLHLLLPDTTGARYTTGQRVPLYAMLSSDKPLDNASVRAFVTSPGGEETQVHLYDDGEHGDGSAGDGLYANLFTHVNQAVTEPPSEPGPTPNDEGAYRVRVSATGPGFEREALGSFSVLEGEDANGNRLPDAWEQEYGVGQPDEDPDADGLNNWDEYQLGTSPVDTDTDGGGEGDGSESSFGQDALNPGDDEAGILDPIGFIAGNGKATIVYDIPDRSDLALYRATDPGGPWTLRHAPLPPGGVYDDPATNDVTYYYRVVPNTGGHIGGGRRTEPVTPRVDPIPPNVVVYIDGGAASTPDLSVHLSFAPRDPMRDGADNFDDIVDMMLSNDPFFESAAWQPFAQVVPWTLDAEPGEWARVYARFRDSAGNESDTAVGLVRYGMARVFLPLVVRQR